MILCDRKRATTGGCPYDGRGNWVEMKYDPGIHHRRSIRLRGYDYSRAGAYFVTICTQDHKCLFGEIVDGEMRLNDAGLMIQAVWDQIPVYYPGTQIDQFVTMPNHIHGIMVVVAPVGATPRGCPGLSTPNNDGLIPKSGQARGPAPTNMVTRQNDDGRLSLPDVVHRFKTMTTKRYADGVKQSGWPPFPGKLWQRNYWEHIVRDESELNRTREYIRNNPAQWELDKLFVRANLVFAPSGPNTIREPSREYATEDWMV